MIGHPLGDVVTTHHHVRFYQLNYDDEPIGFSSRRRNEGVRAAFKETNRMVTGLLNQRFGSPCHVAVLCAAGFAGCGPSDDGLPASSGTQSQSDGGTLAEASTNPDSSTSKGDSGPLQHDGGSPGTDGGTTPTDDPPAILGCPILPANHIFNTPIDAQPVHPNSAAFIATIGPHSLRLDFGTSVDPMAADYYGIPYNVVHGSAMTWTPVAYHSNDPDMSWDPRQESECPNGAAHTDVSPCTSNAAPNPVFPIPVAPLVEGGIDTNPSQPYGDHHILLLDADTCLLWELYHAYPTSGGWDIFGSARTDLRSNALRPAGWTSSDAAGFPIVPLLLRADEATAGNIHHALRFTIQSNHIRNEYTWPGRHFTTNGTSSQNLPPMGQLFRLKASYQVPANFGPQSRAILRALKTYGMYLADGGSDMFLSGEPNTTWQNETFSEMQSVPSSQFEAVDLSSIEKRAGFDPNSAAVPP